MPYTLITVTHGGRVEHTPGFATLLMCQEARSIALTGLTLAENAERRRKEAEQAAADAVRREAEFAAWKAVHFPPRAPTSEEQMHIRAGRLTWPADGRREQQGFKEFCGWTAIYSVRRSKLGADGLVHDEIGRTFSYDGGGGFRYPSVTPEVDRSGHIKHAVCVIEMPDEPVASVEAAA